MPRQRPLLANNRCITPTVHTTRPAYASPTREPMVQASSCLPNSHIQEFCLLIGETLGCFEPEVQIQTKGLLYAVLDIVRQELVNLQSGAVPVADTTRHIVSLIQSLGEVQDQFSRPYDAWLRPSSMGAMCDVAAIGALPSHDSVQHSGPTSVPEHLDGQASAGVSQTQPSSDILLKDRPVVDVGIPLEVDTQSCRLQTGEINICQLPLSVPPSTYAIRLHSTGIPLEQPDRLLRQLRSSDVPEHPSKRRLKIRGGVEDDAPTKRSCITASNALPLTPLSCQYPDLHPRFVHTLEKIRQRAYGFLEKDITNPESSSPKDRQRKNVDVQLVFYAEKLFGPGNITRITNLFNKYSSLYAIPLLSSTASAYEYSTDTDIFDDKSHIPDQAPSSGHCNANPIDAKCLLLRQVQCDFRHATWAAMKELQGTEDLAVLSRTLDLYLPLIEREGSTGSLDMIKTALRTVAFYKDYMFLSNRVQCKGSSAQLILKKLGYKLGKGRSWASLLRSCFLSLTTGSKDLSNSEREQLLLKNTLFWGCKISLMADSFGEGIFYVLPNCLSKTRVWLQPSTQATCEALAEEFPGLRVAAEHVYAAACRFENPGTRSDTSLIADLDKKLSVLNYDRVEDTAESPSS